MSKPNYKTREEARELYERSLAAPAPEFSTYPHDSLREFWAFNLRWLDCAPKGARFICAPMQDKHGIPMGTTWSENIGPSKSLREARIRRGLNPFPG